jgi:hypothetical protein
MSASLKSNAESSASTPSIEPPPQSERELLKLRETQAKAALRTTVKALGHNLASLIDPRSTIKEHPWKSSGVAALAGFFVALKVVPSSEERAETKLKENVAQDPPGPSPWASLASTLVETGSGAVKAALMPWLAQKIQQWMPQGEAPEPATEEARPEEVPFSP